MLDDQVFALNPATFARLEQQFLGQRRHEAAAGKPQPLEFLRVDQAAGAVVPEYELVAFDDIGARGGFRRSEFVTYDLEHQIVRRQRENDHDQAAIAGRMHETVDRFIQVALKCEIALRLALLGAAEDGVELVDGFTGA